MLKSSFKLRSRIAEALSRFPCRIWTWLILALVTTLLQLVLLVWFFMTEQGVTYEVASAPPENATLAVRFVAKTSIAEISMFLSANNASIIAGPGPGGFYRLRIADSVLSQKELAKIAHRIAAEKIVDVTATVN